MSVFLGLDEISKMYLGDYRVRLIYLGEELVYDARPVVENFAGTIIDNIVKSSAVNETYTGIIDGNSIDTSVSDVYGNITDNIIAVQSAQDALKGSVTECIIGKEISNTTLIPLEELMVSTEIIDTVKPAVSQLDSTVYIENSVSKNIVETITTEGEDVNE